MCLSGRRLHGQEAVQFARVVVDDIGRDEAATPEGILGEEDTLPWVQLDAVLGAQLDMEARFTVRLWPNRTECCLPF